MSAGGAPLFTPFRGGAARERIPPKRAERWGKDDSLRGTLEVHRNLVERGIPHEFYRLDRPLRRIDDAPALLGLDPLIVVAAELFEASEARVLALTPVTMRAQ